MDPVTIALVAGAGLLLYQRSKAAVPQAQTQAQASADPSMKVGDSDKYPVDLNSRPVAVGLISKSVIQQVAAPTIAGRVLGAPLPPPPPPAAPSLTQAGTITSEYSQPVISGISQKVELAEADSIMRF